MENSFNKPRKNFGPRRFDKKPGNFDQKRRSFSPREMHKAKCGKCGKECEVPFKPTEGRPVYCRDCFSKQKPQRPQRFGPRNNQRNQRFSGGPRRR